MTAAELKELDDKRRQREEELFLLLLLLLGWAVTQELVTREGTTETPTGGNRTNGTPASNRVPTGTMEHLADILGTEGVAEIAGSMADAHLDAFAVYEDPLGIIAPTRAELVREYEAAAREMVDAMVQAVAEAKAGTLADALLVTKYSKTDGTALQLGIERQIVTASNGGLIASAVMRRTGPKLTGFNHKSVIDDRTTRICLERDGLKLAATDPYWEVNFPSLHWRCRSVVVPIFGPFKASDWRPRTPPDVGFGRMPAAVRRMLRRLAA